MSHFDGAITPVAGVGANIRSRRQSGCPGGAQATECIMFDECNCPNRCKELV